MTFLGYEKILKTSNYFDIHLDLIQDIYDVEKSLIIMILYISVKKSTKNFKADTQGYIRTHHKNRVNASSKIIT